MSVLIFADQHEGKFRKSTFEAVHYGAKLAAALATSPVALAVGSIDDDTLKTLGNFGAQKVLHAPEGWLDRFDSSLYQKLVMAAAAEVAADVVVFSHNFNGKAIAPMLSAAWKAGWVPGATGLPDLADGFVVPRGVFSGKAFCRVKILTEKKIISLSPNSFPVTKTADHAEVVPFGGKVTEADARVKILSTEKLSGAVPLPEADIIVSAGRGLKGPENWGMIEDLAESLGAATACSRPVADSGWRPHHEHVGQTGITVRPNLYIAVGISGAIQHLAGVNGSKNIVVINKDPEAPFFKAADYGVVGDAFEVVPRLTQAVKAFKAGGH